MREGVGGLVNEGDASYLSLQRRQAQRVLVRFQGRVGGGGSSIASFSTKKGGN